MDHIFDSAIRAYVFRRMLSVPILLMLIAAKDLAAARAANSDLIGRMGLVERPRVPLATPTAIFNGQDDNRGTEAQR